MLSLPKIFSSRRFCFGLIFLLSCHPFVVAQENLDFDVLYIKIEEAENGVQRDFYLKSYLHKAKEEENLEEIFEAYRNYLYYREGEILNIYIDSMKWAAYKTHNNEIIGDALLSAGIQKYKQKSYGEALSYYSKAYHYISFLEDDYLRHKILYSLAQVHYILGFVDVAIQKFEECMVYFEGKDLDGYLNSLHGLASCYTNLGNYGKSSELVHRGIEASLRNSSHRMVEYFEQLEGINYYHQDKWEVSLKILKHSTESIAKKGDFANAQVGYFYLGKIHQNLQLEEKAVDYFRKIDSLFVQHSFVRPNLRIAYDYLIDNHSLRNQPEESFYFMKQRLAVDKITENMYLNLYPRLFQGDLNFVSYPAEKGDNRFRLDYVLLYILFISFVLLILIRYLPLNKTQFSSVGHGVILKYRPEKNILSSRELKDVQTVPLESLESLLPRLEKFEKERKYLEKDWKQTELAVYLKSNVRYCNLLIQQFRGKHYTHYMNDLKIEHIVGLLQTDSKVRKYTNGALAKEGGFKSTEKFVKAFKSKMGQNIMEYLEGELKRN